MNYNQYKGIKITKRNDGRWNAKPTLNKKQHTIYGKTQKECYENLKAFFNENKIIKFEKSISFFEYWEFWYKTYKAPFYKEGTLKNYRSVFKNQIKPNFNDGPIKNITALEINLSVKKNSGLQNERVHYTILKRIFQTSIQR